MKANSLSINIPNVGCNKACPYCISKMTGYEKYDDTLYMRNLKKLKRMADNSRVNSVIFTGKGEPLLEGGTISHIAEIFKDYPLEVQTNGILLQQENGYISHLFVWGIDTIAISIDKWTDIQKDSFIEMLQKLNYFGFTIRLTVNLVHDTYYHTVKEYIDYCESHSVQQLSFRKVVAPTNLAHTKLAEETKNWIEEHIDDNIVNNFMENWESIMLDFTLVRHLPFGASIYMAGDVSITYFDYCIQDESNNDDIRSLIYHEDGHLSTSWNGSNWGRIF